MQADISRLLAATVDSGLPKSARFLSSAEFSKLDSSGTSCVVITKVHDLVRDTVLDAAARVSDRIVDVLREAIQLRARLVSSKADAVRTEMMNFKAFNALTDTRIFVGRRCFLPEFICGFWSFAKQTLCRDGNC